MSEETTTPLTDSEKLDLVLERLAKLEERVEERLKDTRPMWQAIHAQTEKIAEEQTRIATTLSHIKEQLEVMTQDVMDVRTAQRSLGHRVAALERRESLPN